MHQNYIFDLYGTLADIWTNECKGSLWKYMAQYMSLQGVPYTAPELRKRYRELIKIVRAQQCREYAEYCKTSSQSKDTLSEPYATLPEQDRERRLLLSRFPDFRPEEVEVDLSRVISCLYSEKGFQPAPQTLADWALAFRSISMNYEKLYEGAEEVLMQLRSLGRGVYLLSNAQRLFTVPELRALGIYDLFDDVLISSDIGFMKPSRQFYQALLTRHRLDPASCVMIGNDWQADAWGAHHNGLASMYVHTAQSPALTGELPPDCVRLRTIADVLTAAGIQPQ